MDQEVTCSPGRTRLPGPGTTPKLKYRDPTLSVKDLIMGLGQAAARTLTWRDGSRIRTGRPVPMRSRFVVTRGRPAGRVLLATHRRQDLTEAWLIAQWPPGANGA